MELRKIGIQPDVLICRTERELHKDDAEKIAQFCNVERRAVIEERDKEVTVYEVPVSLKNNKLDEFIIEKFQLKNAQPIQMDDWLGIIETIKNPKHEVTIAVVGKYVKHADAYKSVYEALMHAGIANEAKVIVKKVSAEHIERDGLEKFMANIDGLLVPGGFDVRGIQGKLDAIRHARESKLPFFGICLGLQCAAIEFARNVVGLSDANSTEFTKTSSNFLVCMLSELKGVTNLGGTMRLGAYNCRLQAGTRAYAAYKKEIISERHRHRYEVNNDYRGILQQHGLVIAGTTLDNSLVEVIELKDHPWFLAVQCHPEFKSKPNEAHPLFRDFITAALKHKAERKK
jgi:CTP synthase